jgi:quinolinate synthase
VCTSSNAAEIFNRVLSSGKRVFFIPDRNLGMNTAVGMGLADRAVIAGTKTEEEQLRDRKIVVWDGHCSVHTVFSLRHIEQKRAERPGIRVIVHPECEPEVAAAADMAGSTAFIKKTIENALPGSFWAVGTEFNFVNRLQRENPDRSVLPLDRSVCRDMSLITEEHLFETLAGIERGDFSSRVEVDDETAADASRAIQRMFSPGEV